ncbi:RidA family protein [Dechloromonas denitrificans]|uniref:RidA family protein n=1 Tax=Dechloromonas denitrificans TaxID=281362 RepID=UPI001CF9F49F|nr:RidA family protein [Dechloromonas denitrificans]UCV08714.1 RidA family protein [Dechloromonas denitrificans]
MPIQRHGTTRRYSDSVVHNGTVYLVEVPSNLDADITEQTQNLLAGVERLLTQAGSDKSRLLMVTIYLADMADYDAMNAVWDAWLPDGCAPSRACIEARLAKAEFKVEMALTAAL